MDRLCEVPYLNRSMGRLTHLGGDRITCHARCDRFECNKGWKPFQNCMVFHFVKMTLQKYLKNNYLIILHVKMWKNNYQYLFLPILSSTSLHLQKNWNACSNLSSPIPPHLNKLTYLINFNYTFWFKYYLQYFMGIWVFMILLFINYW